MVTPKAVAAKCDFCELVAQYDGKTKLGPWAYMCEEHRKQYGVADERFITRLNSPEDYGPKKKCTRCNQVKLLTEFYKYTDHSGTERYRPECKVCNLQDKQIKYKRSKENEQS